MAYDNELQGVLFKNDKKETDKHPDYKGSIQIDGKEYWLSSWINEKKDGSGKYMSIKAQLKENQGGYQSNQGEQKNQNFDPKDPFADNGEPSDSVPF